MPNAKIIASNSWQSAKFPTATQSTANPNLARTIALAAGMTILKACG
jgi:hypothetical protein